MSFTSINEVIPRVAIVGGGQLGFLLCQAARALDIKTLVITPDAGAPALTIATEAIVIDYSVTGLAARIAEWADVVTFELEAVPEVLLTGLEAEQSAGNISIYPDVAALRLLKNKARQKAWLSKHGFASADFIELSKAEVAARLFLEGITFPFVQKAQEGGYDGYGVQIIREQADVAKLWPVACIIETYLAQARELSVMVARSPNGNMEVFPPVEMAVDQGRNVLDLVISPAPLSATKLELAEALARNVIEQLKGVGIFAVEMFLTADDELLINEISPRVHNSGHHTLESCNVSQFEQHVRAVTGMPLIAPQQRAPSIMKNILYEDSLSVLMGAKPGRIPTQSESIQVHWYGKKEARAGRKMGHITCVGAEPASGSLMIDKALSELKLKPGESIE